MRFSMSALILMLVGFAPNLLRAEARSDGRIELTVASDKPVSVGRGDLAKLPRVDVKAKAHDDEAIWSGVPLRTLLEAHGAPLGERLRGRRLASYVVVTAADGYRVVFSLGELDEALGDSTAFLADLKDGVEMGPEEGPFRIVVPDESRPARWVRQVRRIELVDVAE